MKSKIYKILYFFCVSAFVFVYSFNVYSTIVWADVPSGQIVVGNSSTWSGFPFTYNTTGKYYTVSDPTGIPQGSYLAPKYFYTTDNVKFFTYDALTVFTYALNKIAGVIYEPNELNTLFGGFLNAIKVFDSTNNKYVANGLYDSNDNFYGYVLNDISGCYYGGNAPSGTNVKDDGKYGDNVREYYDYQNTESIPFFTLYGISDNYIFGHLNSTSSLDSTSINYYQEYIVDYDLCLYLKSNRDGCIISAATGSNNANNRKTVACVDTIKYAVCSSSLNDWNIFTDLFVIGNECLLTDYVGGNTKGEGSINGTLYNSSNSSTLSTVTMDLQNKSLNVNNPGQPAFNLGFWSNGIINSPYHFETLTIYRDSTTFTNVDTQLYTPSVFYNDSYNNYDSNNDNSINVPLNVISQSISNNSNIFNSSSDNYYNYYDNGVYDQSSATTNITNITNNYYTDNGGGNNPDNPDDPNNPDDPSNVLDQILEALLRFFNAIGAVLGTILTGILTIISEILEAIASITVSLTSITDFFGAIFSWIPDPVPQVLGLGFTICILCGIIKFIRG